MKKVLALLLVLGVLISYPLDIFAEEGQSALYMPSSPSKKEDNGDGTLTYYYPITVNNTGDFATKPFEKVEVQFTFGSAITSYTCSGTGKYTATQTNAANGGKCTFTSSAADPGTGDKISIGTLVVVLQKDGKDCSIKARYLGVESDIVPETGVSVPYAIILGGVVLAAGVYFVTKKKTRLQRI